MKKIKIAQIGIKHDHATACVQTLKKLCDIFELVGVAAPDSDVFNPVNANGLSDSSYEGVSVYTIEELLNMELDAVAIESDELTSTKYAKMFIDKGVHVYLDKPGGVDHKEFCDMVNTAREKNLVFNMGYMYRYNPVIQKVIEEIKNGDFGEIYSVEAHMDCMHKDEKREWLKQFPGGMLYFLGCHLIDLIFAIQGEPEEIIPLSCATGIENTTAEDYGMAVFKYKNGVSFAKTCAAEPGGFMRRQLVVCGSKKTVEIKPLEYYAGGNDIKTDYREMTREKALSHGWGVIGEKQTTEPFDRYENMLKGFYNMIAGEKSKWDYDYEIKLHEILLKSCGEEI
ncbi:MAG: Gfo/Idh/MocA family oxidoreductase [Clostridia bacterium]|nr:Gfo/Idh/MocA family oxidoreductase [Clostridia bacterium]